MFIIDFDLINKGNIAELFVGLELIKSKDAYENMALYYWHREAKNSKVEVDCVIQNQDISFPLEVKAHTKRSDAEYVLVYGRKEFTIWV